MKIRYLLPIIMLVAFTLPLFSQTAQLTGRVTDPSTAVIPGAQVRVTNEATGLSRTVTSDEAGYFTVTLLDPSTYKMTVDAAGFKQSARSGIMLEVGQAARIDFTLEVGRQTEVVTVTGTAPVVEKETASLGAVVERVSVSSLPLNQRNPYLLALLAPGVTPGSSVDSASYREVAFYPAAAAFMVNGGRIQAGEFLLDGTSNTANWSDTNSSVPVMPAADSVQEFKVQTNSYSAEFGRSSGGVINMVMRSGTNQFHGSAHDYLKNSVLDANDFFANRAGRPLGSFKRNVFGGTFGGPVLHDKAFFFVSYEGFRSRTATTFTATVPTVLERTGDFSKTAQSVSGRCTPVTIYDPTTTRANPSGTGWVRDPFPGNKIPSYRFDKVGANILGLYPTPNTAGNSCSNASNFFQALGRAVDTDQFDSRFDYARNERNRFNGGLNWRRHMTAPPNNYGTLANSNWEPYNDPSEGARLNYTRIQAANFLINARLGVARAIRDIPTKKNIDLTNLGFPQSLLNQMVHPLDIPQVQPTGYGNIGMGYQFSFCTGTTYSFNGNGAWVRGKHTIKFGGDVRFLQSYEFTGFGASGSYTFGRDFTQGPNPLAASAIAGNGAASLLLGSGSGSIQILPPVLTSSQYYALFLQEDVRVTDKLVLNVGLRYDVEPGRTERFNQLSWFDFSAPSPLAQKVAAFPNLRGGFRFVGVDAKRQFDTDMNNLGPRVGLAYTINRKTVLRTGYGIFYPMFSGGAAGAKASNAGFQTASTWLSSLDGVTPLNYLASAFPQGLQMPTGSALGLMTYLGGALGLTGRDGAVDRKTTTGYMQHWNLNLQRALPSSITLELAYAGSKGTKLSYSSIDVNQLPPAALQLGSALNQLVANPFYGFIPGAGPLSQPQVQRGQLLRPYPQFQNVYAMNLDAADSIYHSFQLRAQKQFAQGLTFMVGYTNAKLINDSDAMASGWGQITQTQNTYDRRSDRALSALDISQRLTINYVYVLPFGRGRHFGSSWSPWLDRAIGGWQFNGVTVFSKGFPLALTAANTSGAYNLEERPNVNGQNPNLPGGRSTTAKLARWFDTSVFSQPAPFTFGNGPRLLPNVRSDGRKNFDMSLFKAFPIREQMRVEFRAELFNAFNTPRFGNPNLVVGNASFGISSSQANSPRVTQMALKFMF